MSTSSRSLLRGATKLTSTLSRRPISSFNKTAPAENKGPGASEQAMPIGPYYEAILVKPQPIPNVKPEDPPQSSPKAPRSTARKSASAQTDTAVDTAVDTAAAPVPSPSTKPATAQEKAIIVFGSPLAGPFERAERLKAMKEKSKLIAGILVPPKPEEPDNCCMSGCVNCVWDRFRDEMEEWASASTRAEKRLQKLRAQGPVEVMNGVNAVKGMEGLKGPGAVAPSAGIEALSMDNDEGGSDSKWTVKDLEQAKVKKDFWDEELYKGVPVGIREFMKTEKKLKERHEQEESVGG